MKAFILLCLVAVTAAEPPVGKYLPPSGSYGAPSGFGGNGGYSGGRGGGYDEGPSEPANYEFSYQVKDDFGNDFGHSEQRQGDVAKGRYYVLLPDGRMQIVEYTADENGYQPQIKYEGQANAAGGYPRGGAGGSYGAPSPQGGYNSGFAPSGNAGFGSGSGFGADGYRYK